MCYLCGPETQFRDGAGRCELYFEYLLSPWDFAAASLILEEAGGVLSNREGLPLDFTKPSGVLAANSQENLNRLVAIVMDCLWFRIPTKAGASIVGRVRPIG